MSKQLKSYVTVGGETYPPGPVSAEVAKQITNPKAWESNAGEGPKEFADMNKAELEAEVDSRNAARAEADAITVEGSATKANLLAAIQADDAK